MLHRSANAAIYAEDMAKVEIEFPDDFLRQIDEAADRAGETRDEFLRRSVEEEVVRNQAAFRKELEEMLPPPIRGGGESERWIREDRDHRDDKRLGRDPDDA
jgi:hypothetical protein